MKATKLDVAIWGSLVSTNVATANQHWVTAFIWLAMSIAFFIAQRREAA